MSETDLLLVFAVSLAGSFAKSVTGMGYPLIAVPVLALFLGAETAIVVVAVPNAVLNLILALHVRETLSETRDLPILSVAAVLGGICGALVLVAAPEEPLLIALAATILAFVIQRTRQPALRLAPATTKRWSPLVGLAAGMSHGALGVSAPIVALWLHAYRLPKNAYVLSVTTLFLLGGLAQLAVLLSAGSFGSERVIASGVALGATLLMIPVGTRVRGRLAGETFDRLILALLIISGVALLWRALA